MGNIYTYIENYCNDEIDEITYLDALIFSRLSYVHIEKLQDKLPFSIMDLNNYLNHLKISSKDKKLINLLSMKKRFKNLYIERCLNIEDDNKREQFFAMTIHLPHNNFFIAFRGTNKSIVGLIEDLDMSYKVIPSQEEAVSYLEGENLLKNLYLGGHSKGGNLAIYALLNSDFLKRKQIKKVYNFDGPGLLEIKNKNENEKIINFYPQCSIVGRLLNSVGNINIIKSNKLGLEGHNIYNWVINNDDFEYSSFLKESDDLQKATISFLEKINRERRMVIINFLYELIRKREFNIANFDLYEFKKIIIDAPNITDYEKEELIKYIKIFIKVSLPEIVKKEN